MYLFICRSFDIVGGRLEDLSHFWWLALFGRPKSAQKAAAALFQLRAGVYPLGFCATETSAMPFLRITPERGSISAQLLLYE